MSETILEEAQRLVMGDRQQDYGSPFSDFSGTAEMLSGFLRDKLTKPITAEEVGLIMVIVKLSRLRNSLKRDSLVDLAGYAQTVQMVKDERERHAKEEAAECCLDVEKCNNDDCLFVQDRRAKEAESDMNDRPPGPPSPPPSGVPTKWG